MGAGNKQTESAVLLTGATGFVGGHLMRSLVDTVALRLLVRDPEGITPDHRHLAMAADLGEVESLAPVLEGMEHVYYLVHSMEPGAGEEFAERDRQAAENYAEVARRSGVQRTIYLGGIGGGDSDSEHLRSRREVEKILGEASPEFVALRASMIVGAGSASFETLVRIVDRLPVLALPDWRDRKTQPIAIDDVVEALSAARGIDPGGYEIAGPDTVSFEQMTETISALLGEEHRAIHLPFSNAPLEGAAAAAVTGEDRELLEPLMAGLHGDLTVDDNRLEEIIGRPGASFEDAAEKAIAEMGDVGSRD